MRIVYFYDTAVNNTSVSFIGEAHELDALWVAAHNYNQSIGGDVYHGANEKINDAAATVYASGKHAPPTGAVVYTDMETFARAQ